MPCRSPNCWRSNGRNWRVVRIRRAGSVSSRIFLAVASVLMCVRRTHLDQGTDTPCLPEDASGLMPAILLAVLIVGCDSSPQPAGTEAPQRVTITVTSYPLLVMVETLAGGAADVKLVVPEDTTSPNWKPGASAIRTMQDATRILISGASYEPWLQRVTLPRSRLIDTAQGYYDQFIRIPDAVVHQHGPDGQHSHAGTVWAAWLDPELAASQLQQVQACLTELLPASRADVQQAADDLTAELDQLDQRVERITEATSAGDIVALGDAPVYQYLTRRLGWSLTYIHLPAGGPLSEDQRQAIHDAIAQHGPAIVLVRSALWEELHDVRSAAVVPFAEIDLCESADVEHLLTGRLNQNLTNITDALKIESPEGH